jgi:hypothetical protein
MDLDSRHLVQDPEDGQWKRVMFYLHPDHHVRWRFVALDAYEKED